MAFDAMLMFRNSPTSRGISPSLFRPVNIGLFDVPTEKLPNGGKTHLYSRRATGRKRNRLARFLEAFSLYFSSTPFPTASPNLRHIYSFLLSHTSRFVDRYSLSSREFFELSCFDSREKERGGSWEDCLPVRRKETGKQTRRMSGRKRERERE